MKRPIPSDFQSRLPVSSEALDTSDRVIAYCRKHGFLNQYETVDIQQLIEQDPKIELIFEDLGDKDAYIKCIAHDSFIISINKSHHKNRQVFSMAHEYGHYQLHRHQIKNIAIGEKILHRDGEVNSIEQQANRFASDILMPENSVHKAMTDAQNNIIRAASLLGVSAAALTYRLNYLKVYK